MSVAVKAAGFAVMLRVLLACFSDPLSASAAAGWPPLIAGLAVVTMVYGNIAAVGQTSVKRMLAYSSIAHAGYILVAVASTFRVEAREAAVSSLLFYLLAYTASNVLAFGSLIAMGSHGKEAVSFEDLAGAGLRHPLAALPFVIGVLSLMGFPPTAGFFAKYYVFKAAIDVGGAMLYVAIIGVLSSAIGAFYYLKVIVFLFMKQPEPGAPQAVPMRSGYITLALILAGYFVLKMGVSPSNYIDLAVRAAADLV
jgi:NADH-quinone oxidoreductase subunit N